MKVVRTDEAAALHIDQLATDGGDAIASRYSKQTPGRRPVAGRVHGLGLADSDKQQLVFVRDDDIALQQVTELAAFMRAGAHLGHGGGGKAFAEKWHQVFAGRALRVLGRTAGNVGQPARTGHQAHAHLDKADIAFHSGHAPG